MYPLVQWSSYDHITLLKKRSWLCPRPHPIPSHPIPSQSHPSQSIPSANANPPKKNQKVEGGVNDPHLGPIDIRSRCKTCDEGGGGGFAGKSEPKTATFKTKKLNGGWFGIDWLVGWLIGCGWLVELFFFVSPFLFGMFFSRSVFFF